MGLLSSPSRPGQLMQYQITSIPFGWIQLLMMSWRYGGPTRDRENVFLTLSFWGFPPPPLSRWKYVYPPCSRGSRMSFENAAQWEPGTILINRLRSVIVQRSLCLHENDENLNMALGGIGAWWLVCAEHSIRIYWDATLEKQCWRHLLLAFGMISDNSHWNLQQGNIVEPFCIGILFPDM